MKIQLNLSKTLNLTQLISNPIKVLDGNLSQRKSNIIILYLASKGAMNIRFLKTSITRSAIISRAFKLSILRSLLDEHHFGTIYGIWLTKQIKQNDLQIS